VAVRVKSEEGDRGFRAQGPGFAVALLVSVVVGGTIGYMAIEGWNAWDAFYMTVITVTTVGYKEVHDLSRAGQLFTVILLFGGVGSALYTFTLLATVVVEGGLPKRLQRRRNQRMLDTMKDHFIICGYGRIGSIVAHQFQRQHIPYVVIERARGLIAAVGTDAENVYAVLTARVLRPDLFIVGRAETDDATTKLKRAGADRVISPYQIGAMQMAQTALRPAVVDFMALATSSDNLELAMEEVTVTPTSTLVDQSLLTANLRQRYGVIVVGIQRKDLRMEFNPEPDTTIHAGDKLVVLGRPDSLKQLDNEAAR